MEHKAANDNDYSVGSWTGDRLTSDCNGTSLSTIVSIKNCLEKCLFEINDLECRIRQLEYKNIDPNTIETRTSTSSNHFMDDAKHVQNNGPHIDGPHTNFVPNTALTTNDTFDERSLSPKQDIFDTVLINQMDKNLNHYIDILYKDAIYSIKSDKIIDKINKRNGRSSNDVKYDFNVNDKWTASKTSMVTKRTNISQNNNLINNYDNGGEKYLLKQIKTRQKKNNEDYFPDKLNTEYFNKNKCENRKRKAKIDGQVKRKPKQQSPVSITNDSITSKTQNQDQQLLDQIENKTSEFIVEKDHNLISKNISNSTTTSWKSINAYDLEDEFSTENYLDKYPEKMSFSVRKNIWERRASKMLF